jgi:predicted AAA+ superfamily ATPase
MAFIAGPRQVGKTTLGRLLQEQRNSQSLYRNWDDAQWRKDVIKNPYGFVDTFHPADAPKPLVVIDEIHKFPRWKRYLKGLYDTRKEHVDILITGSGRLDYFQKGGDSLLGRYHLYRMHPLSVREIVGTALTDEAYTPQSTLDELHNSSRSTNEQSDAFERLYTWGGFPEPFTKQNQRFTRQWLRERKALLIKEDLRDLFRVHSISNLELFTELILAKAGNPLTLNTLVEDVGVSQPTLRIWLGFLEQIYYAYTIPPYHRMIARALKKDRKVYLWDWSEISNEGARFENIIAAHLLKMCHFTEDFGFEPLRLFYVRDKEKREVDFLIVKNKTPWILIEAKTSDTTPPSTLHRFASALGVQHCFLVVKNRLPNNGVSQGIRIMDAASFLSCLPV